MVLNITKNLKNSTGLSHDSVIIHLQAMENEEIVKKNGHKGKWYLTDNAYNIQYFGQGFLEKM